MQRLVSQLLVLARVEKLTELDDVERLRLLSVTETALRDISERAAARSIELSREHDGNDFVQGSEGLLGILVQNLLDNALRHTPQGGQVNVRVGGTDEHVVLEIHDSGGGFVTTDAASLVERLHRPDGSVGDGSGLGLSIAQAIAGLHHGQFAFSRSSLGGGRIPLTLPQAIHPQKTMHWIVGAGGSLCANGPLAVTASASNGGKAVIHYPRADLKALATAKSASSAQPHHNSLEAAHEQHSC